MSFGLPSVKVKPEHGVNIKVQEGPFGVPDPMVAGLGATKLKLGTAHPIETSERNFHMNEEKMNMAMLRNIQGLHAPLKLTMEHKFARKLQMDSKRKGFYKNYITVGEETKKNNVAKRKGRKRSANPIQNDSSYVTKLRRASEADYLAIRQPSSPGNGPRDNTSIRLVDNVSPTMNLLEDNLCASNAADLENLSPKLLKHIRSNDTRSTYQDNPQGSSINQLEHPVDARSTCEDNLEGSLLKQLEHPVDARSTCEDNPEGSSFNQLESLAARSTCRAEGSSMNQLELPLDARSTCEDSLEGSSFNQLEHPLDARSTCKDNPESSLLNELEHPPDARSTYQDNPKGSSSSNQLEHPLDTGNACENNTRDSLSNRLEQPLHASCTHLTNLCDSSSNQLENCLLTSVDQANLNEFSEKSPALSLNVNSSVYHDELDDVSRDIMAHSSQIQVVFEADIHQEPGIRSLSRNEEIGICLQQIRSENDSINIIKREISDNCQLSTITIDIELEEESCNNVVINNNPNNKTHQINVKNIDTEPEKGKRANKNKKDVGKKCNKKPNIEKYQYIDFLSDDECFAYSSSSWEGSQSNTDTPDETPDKKKMQKKKLLKKRNTIKKSKKEINESEKKDNQMNENMRSEDSQAEISTNDLRKIKKKRINKSKDRSYRRHLGKEYVTKTGKVMEAKKMKENLCVQGKCPNECYNVPEEKRKNIFNHYWSLTNQRRRDWLVSHIKREPVKRKRTKDVDSRRRWTHSYFINEGEGLKQVCLTFILNTLDIRQKYVHRIIDDSVLGSSNDDKRGQHIPANKTSPALLQSAKSYIEDLPAVPSHYCRKNTKKCYLPQEFRNLSTLYKIYKEKKQTEGNAFIGEKVFKNLFLTEFNISFHVPRKDKCIKCIKYENDTSGEHSTEKEIHLKDKENTYARFQNHQEIHKHDATVLCSTFDLQKVLNTPYGQSMLLYYSRKLAVYNLTFYESQTREGFCFTWNEAQGKRGANEICTILAKYVETVDTRGTIKTLLLYCDSCPGQNKNKVVLACLSRCLQKCISITTIQINYLLPGHTYMPVDSMHAVIEKSVSNTIIWAPSQWPTVFSLARKVPKPYDVQTLSHKYFEGWDAISDKYFKGNLVGKISKIRIATLKKSCPDKIQVKYSMDVDSPYENIEIIRNDNVNVKKIYKAPLPISKKKYSDLLKLCTNKTIPEQFHNEYKDLPCAANIGDVLPESDIEDEEFN